MSSAEGQGNSDSFRPSISADGRYVAFESDASDLVANDTNGVRDVFVRGPLH
jgi:Tol biopolymer transport system component